MKKRKPTRIELNRAEESMDRIELLVRRKGEIGELRGLFRWGANLSEPAPSGGGMGYRRAPGHSAPTESQSNDPLRRSIYLAVREAEASLEHAYGVLHAVLGGNLTIPRGGDMGSFITRADLDESHAMQIKRQEQGGGFGAT